MKSKTIIISSQSEKNNGRGILTIYEEDGLLKCKLRLYNTPALNRYCKLGIYHQSEVFSANLLEKSGVYTSSFAGSFDMEKDFYTAIVDTSNQNNVLLAGGTYAGYFFNDTSVFNNLEKENPTTNLFNYNNENLNQLTPNDEEIFANKTTLLYNEDSNKNVETEKEESTLDCNKCEHCKYKEFFYAQNEQHLETNYIEDNKENTIKSLNSPQVDKQNEETSSENTILASLIPQFKYVFENYPEDETLNTLIPNGKFVKIQETNEKYSLGAIYEDDEMRFICYAVFKTYNTPAPEELGEHHQWLPIDKEDPLSDGYYIVFQDTKDLKIVNL